MSQTLPQRRQHARLTPIRREDLLSREFALSSEQIMMVSDNGNFESVRREFQSLQRRFLTRTRGDPKWRMEIRKRVAEQIFMTAISKGCPFEICRDSFGRLQKLGFSSFYWKLHWLSIFGRCCLWSASPNEGLVVLESIEAEVRRKERKGTKLVSKRDFRTFRQILNELRAAADIESRDSRR